VRAYHNGFEVGNGERPKDLPGLKLKIFKKREERSSTILQILRTAAKHYRRNQAQRFYSIRDVSRGFHISPATAARIFNQLKSEGLLRSVWGSKTLIEPTRLDKKLHIRGVVVLPACLRDFSAILDYRSFFLELQEVLWQLGFATRLIFYEKHEVEEPGFADRLLSCKVDVVIWFLPSPKVKETAARLTDHGIRVVSVTDSDATFGEYRYVISREMALKEALVDWQGSGISSVVVVRQSDYDPTGEPAMIEKCLRDARMPCTTINIGSRASHDCLHESLTRSDRVFVFPSSKLAVEFRHKYPAHFAKLLRESRVILTERVIDLPASETLNGGVETIEFDWKAIAKRIGSDLVNVARSRIDQAVTFQAERFCETWIDC
jgi:hypothetical protein